MKMAAVAALNAKGLPFRVACSAIHAAGTRSGAAATARGARPAHKARPTLRSYSDGVAGSKLTPTMAIHTGARSQPS